jgi:glycylpeptide N-tetradecanoyltransferase
MLNYFII